MLSMCACVDRSYTQVEKRVKKIQRRGEAPETTTTTTKTILLSRLRAAGDKRRKKHSSKMGDCWRKLVFPVRKVWLAVSARVKARKQGAAGLLKLHDDIQTCGYEDVQVMWEMLRQAESKLTSIGHDDNANNKQKQHRPFWRIFVWSNHTSCSSLSTASQPAAL
ncbi:unnamed protein product [Cuscuta europaea]|uniref:Uncharacterized protein n=1 Tax=Cuscuta europaea TaxID=41803 RepID=A0A9P1EI23_CUSEU|nr:unnamed protein product [Cuscuta europaea]